VDFTAAVAHPDMMRSLVRLGKILGPKGLMPNPKLGTLTSDVAGAVREVKRGRVEFKMDRAAIVHAPIGKVGVLWAGGFGGAACRGPAGGLPRGGGLSTGCGGVRLVFCRGGGGTPPTLRQLFPNPRL
jgi:hypothetical protein